MAPTAAAAAAAAAGASAGEGCLERLGALGLAPRDKPQHAQLRRASVLVLLFERRQQEKKQLYTLITKRSMNLRSHPGECCFPGGRQDEADEGDDVKTALREAQEEIGLDPQDVNSILCRLDTMESVTHLCVTSIVAFMEKRVDGDDDKKGGCNDDNNDDYDIMTDYPWKLNSDEVDAAFAVPLDFFLTQPESMFQVEWSGEIFAMRTYHYTEPESDGGRTRTFKITGLTAHIAHEVARVAYNHTTTTADDIDRIQTTSTKQKKEEEGTMISGYLWKQEVSSRGRAYWTRRFFLADKTSMWLHQYDSEQQANRKAQSANKKNRLPLENCKVTSTSAATTTVTTQTTSSSEKFEFSINGVGGRVQWTLAAATPQDRERWVGVLCELSRLVVAAA